MMLSKDSDRAIMREIGERIRRRRLNKDMTQEKIAYLSGVSRSAVQTLESGRSIRLIALVRILRALDSLDSLDVFLPDPGPSPLQAAKMMGRIRQRASGSAGGDRGRDSSW